MRKGVMDGPVVRSIVKTASHSIERLVHRPGNVVRIVPQEGPPIRRSAIVVQRPRGENRAIPRVAVIVESEMKIVCRVNHLMERAKLANRRPIVVTG